MERGWPLSSLSIGDGYPFSEEKWVPGLEVVNVVEGWKIRHTVLIMHVVKLAQRTFLSVYFNDAVNEG